MGVHAGAVLPEEGFGHKGGITTVLESDFLHHQPVGHDIVGHG